MGAEPGWYGEPGNPTIERFWDGVQWTPQTRAAELVPADSGIASASCAIPTCISQREPGSQYCMNHGPRSSSSRTSPRPAAAGSSALVCPHCQVQGKVSSKQVKVKRGISGGKATAAVLTAGFSMLGTGLSRKETHTEMTCRNCRTTWLV